MFSHHQERCWEIVAKLTKLTYDNKLIWNKHLNDEIISYETFYNQYWIRCTLRENGWIYIVNTDGCLIDRIRCEGIQQLMSAIQSKDVEVQSFFQEILNDGKEWEA